MTLADSVILPFNVTHYGVNLKEYNTRIKKSFEDDFKNINASEEISESFHCAYSLYFTFTDYLITVSLKKVIAEMKLIFKKQEPYKHLL